MFASEPVLLALVFVYAFLAAAFLPVPTEAVLIVPLGFSLPWYLGFPLVIFIASLGSALGSLIALRIGYGVSRSGPVTRLLDRSKLYHRLRTESLVAFVQRYTYVGMLIAVSLPLLPESTTFYAFSVLDDRPAAFALAAGLGTVIRLHIVFILAGGLVFLFT